MGGFFPRGQGRRVPVLTVMMQILLSCDQDRHDERWILELLGGLDERTVQQLYTQLGALRVQLVHNHEPSTEER